VRAGGRLVIEAVIGVTHLVEAMHATIAGVTPPLGKARPESTRGITGLVYRTVRGVTRVVGGSIDLALAPLVPLLGTRESTFARDNVVAALNGVIGDHLAATGNPLASPMQWRSQGRTVVTEKSTLAAAFPHASGKIAILLHGLCMHDGQWSTANEDRRHDHGQALARDLGLTPVYLRYNSGLHISVNGRALSAQLESLIDAWPVPVESVAIIAHSMGGLLARSALHYAKIEQHQWPAKFRSLVFLGTPHHGAPLERGGHGIDAILGGSPYTAPFARIGKIRSAGITDLRYGDTRDEDWQAREAGGKFSRAARALPLLESIPCYAIAASLGKQSGDVKGRVLGDGLVPLASALGRHRDSALALAIPKTRQRVFRGMNHMQLLASNEVYEQIRDWISNDLG
jgi:pimeloyl-ACP methyl ester carboxylesterase